MTGIRRSMRIILKVPAGDSWIFSTASFPFLAQTTLQPNFLTIIITTLAHIAVSSTIRMQGFSLDSMVEIPSFQSVNLTGEATCFASGASTVEALLLVLSEGSEASTADPASVVSFESEHFMALMSPSDFVSPPFEEEEL
eukprot:CAMPEP_0197715696 /NCGR_PEP_ID=MMETSP1434-20131217/806_1 /TAXON_ID=265543 /ORGANISM="Minutocellus polymorphus, Strain CCMP3303" /LENGTH=139 /DNA_ID=CAMNT_0043299891 /DNA_START=341 /DNA_END=757 /DNA_ORIENTATION=+